MSAPKKVGVQTSNLHDFCRLCDSNQKIKGTLQHCRLIFRAKIAQSWVKKEPGTPSPPPIPIVDVLQYIGLDVSEQDESKSHRICEACCRKVARVRGSIGDLNEWKANEGRKDASRSPVATRKRSRETPSKTPRDNKKRATKTPTKAATPSVAAKPDKGKKMSRLPDRKSDTKLSISYQSKERTHACKQDVAGIAENLAKGKFDTCAKMIMIHPTLRLKIWDQLVQQVQAERTSLLATSPSHSILRKTTPSDLQNFSYSAMETELKERTPLLHMVLSNISNDSQVHTCVAASIAIRGKEARMSALAYITDAILQYGGTKKSAMEMLAKMGISTNHNNAVAKQHEMSLNHDKTVKEWKRDLEAYYNRDTSQPASTNPSLSQPASTNPALSQPASNDPSLSQPASTNPALSQPASNDPSLNQPASYNPSLSQPASTHPSLSQPASTHPSLSQSASTHPSLSQPASTHPSLSQPASTHPSLSQPASTDPAPSQPASYNPALSQPASYNPALSQPASYNPSLSQPASTDPSLSEPASYNPSLNLLASSNPPLSLLYSCNTPPHLSFAFEITDEEMAMCGLQSLNIDDAQSPTGFCPLPPCTYGITFDNVNFYVKAHHQTNSKHNTMLNWTHHVAVLDRITPHHLRNTGSTKPLPDLNLDEVLPTHLDQQHTRREFVVMATRVIPRHLKEFEIFKDIVVAHIPHQYSKEMAEKSTEVPLGLLFKDECKTGDLVDILLHFQNEYVPRQGENMVPIFVGGDRLSEGNSRNIQWAFAEGDTREDRLQGIFLKYEDWHAIRNKHGIHKSIFFSEKSAREHGSMCSNMNVLRASNAKKGPHQDYNSYKEFVDKDLDALILTVAMDYFGMDTMEDLPKKNCFPPDIAVADKETRRAWLSEQVGHIIDKYVMLKEGEIVSNVASGVKSSFFPPEPLPCRYPDCHRTFRHEKIRNDHEIQAHDLNMQPTPNPNSSPDKPKESCQEEDYKRNYTLARLSYGLFLRNMRDAVKEGDGERLQRLYSFAMLYYRAYGHTQYAYSSFLMKVQVASILSPHMAHSLVWNRFFNKRGGMGQNISLDLNLENHNNFAKSFLKNMGPNLNEKSALRVTRSLHYLKALMDNQNAALGRRGASGYHHKEKWDEDIKLLVEENRKADLLAIIPGRAFESFPSFNRNLLHKIDYNKTAKWMKEKLKSWNKHYHTDL
ncbi:uncharacterized protein LOC118403134 [Branchiostoma floridae]|uniref:Uncharacterized protein LOC118403134 n=1 Tax=Branchiostoma floridae TaxID=7739 RepID=A0A9J7HGD1_BRAFL|nr:uncharacterized protein LOC118403134 [Branchiostoma floridae]